MEAAWWRCTVVSGSRVRGTLGSCVRRGAVVSGSRVRGTHRCQRNGEARDAWKLREERGVTRALCSGAGVSRAQARLPCLPCPLCHDRPFGCLPGHPRACVALRCLRTRLRGRYSGGVLGGLAAAPRVGQGFRLKLAGCPSDKGLWKRLAASPRSPRTWMPRAVNCSPGNASCSGEPRVNLRPVCAGLLQRMVLLLR